MIVVALLVVTSGCAGLGYDSGPAPTATSTRTTEEPPSRFPPGITSGAASAPFELSAAHAAALRGISYTVNETYEIRYANGTLYTAEAESTRVAADRTTYRHESTVSGTATRFLGASDGTVTQFSNGSVVFRRTRVSGETRYETVDNSNTEPAAPASVSHGTPRNDERIAVVFGAISNVTATRSNGSSYRVEASGAEVDSVEVGGIPIDNLTGIEFDATVTRDGLVREYRLSFEGELRGSDVVVSEHVGYSSVGATSVERPSWVENETERAVGYASDVRHAR